MWPAASDPLARVPVSPTPDSGGARAPPMLWQSKGALPPTPGRLRASPRLLSGSRAQRLDGQTLSELCWEQEGRRGCLSESVSLPDA